MLEPETRALVLDEPESTHEELRCEIRMLLTSDFDVLNGLVRKYDVLDYETEDEAREFIQRVFWVDPPVSDPL
jgi:hypothetical protein